MMNPEPGPRPSLARQTSDELLELSCLADELATRPTPFRARLTPAERRALKRLIALSRAITRQGVIVQLALAPYLEEPIEEAA